MCLFRWTSFHRPHVLFQDQVVSLAPGAHSELTQAHLQTKLSLLHGKDDAILSTHSHDVTVLRWLRHKLQEGYTAYVEQSCPLADGGLQQVHTFTHATG